MASRRVVYFIVLIVISSLHVGVIGEPQVPCLFIFGDSLVDGGNNNNLQTVAKANYLPYGVDFPKGPTGRFTNGRTIADIIAELLGFDNFIPAFTSVESTEIQRGLNYASAAAGIRDESGQNAGDHFSMNMQLAKHNITVQRLSETLGSKESAQKHLNKCLYIVATGSNDYMNNYLVPDFFPTSNQFTSDQYAETLSLEYHKQLQTLHDYGARKLILLGLGSMGCTPNSIRRYGDETKPGECAEDINNLVYLFNDKIVSLVDDFNKKLPDSKFVYVNITGMTTPNDIKQNGFTHYNQECCKVNIMTGQCDPSESPCMNRSDYLFWDSFHPTEAMNKVLASRAYKAVKPTDVYPRDYDISLLSNPTISISEALLTQIFY